jgi:hypothetical protein
VEGEEMKADTLHKIVSSECRHFTMKEWRQAQAELTALKDVVEAATEFHLAVTETGGHLHSQVSKYSKKLAEKLEGIK